MLIEKEYRNYLQGLDTDALEELCETRRAFYYPDLCERLNIPVYISGSNQQKGQLKQLKNLCSISRIERKKYLHTLKLSPEELNNIDFDAHYLKIEKEKPESNYCTEFYDMSYEDTQKRGVFVIYEEETMQGFLYICSQPFYKNFRNFIYMFTTDIDNKYGYILEKDFTIKLLSEAPDDATLKELREERDRLKEELSDTYIWLDDTSYKDFLYLIKATRESEVPNKTIVKAFYRYLCFGDDSMLEQIRGKGVPQYNSKGELV